MRAGEREQATKVRMARVAWRAAAGRRWQEGESTPAASPVAKVHRAELASLSQEAFSPEALRQVEISTSRRSDKGVAVDKSVVGAAGDLTGKAPNVVSEKC